MIISYNTKEMYQCCFTGRGGKRLGMDRAHLTSSHDLAQVRHVCSADLTLSQMYPGMCKANKEELIHPNKQ